MRILVLGGTSFVGRAIVEDALRTGAEVTLFGRGKTAPDLFPDLTRLTGDRDTGDYAALGTGSWDAVVDVSGYVPRHVGQVMDALGERAGRYLFISSHAVYQLDGIGPGIMQLEGVEAALAEAARLLARARAAGIPVFHIMHDAGEGSPYDVHAEIGQISDQVAPVSGEPVIVKNYPNSFVGTDLDARLRQAPGRELILAGFMTHMCVNSTARGAFNLGYRPTVVASATATRALPGPDGLAVPAAALQAASLAAIGDLFGVVVGKSDDIPD